MLFAMDLIILLVGVLQKPLSLRILLALVARLGIYLGNGVALYALVVAILHNGRPLHHTADEEFLTGVVNALLQPPRYAPGHQLLNNPRNRRSLRLSPDSLTPTELTVLRAILQVPQPRDHTSGRPGREATSTTPTTTTATTVSFTTTVTSTTQTTATPTMAFPTMTAPVRLLRPTTTTTSVSPFSTVAPSPRTIGDLIEEWMGQTQLVLVTLVLLLLLAACSVTYLSCQLFTLLAHLLLPGCFDLDMPRHGGKGRKRRKTPLKRLTHVFGK